MTRVSELTGENPQFDRIKSLEAEREQVKVTISLSPRTQFIIERGIQAKLHVSRSAAVRELLEASALDWVEAKGYDLESEDFLTKYLKWLTPQIISIDEAFDRKIISPNDYARLESAGETEITTFSENIEL